MTQTQQLIAANAESTAARTRYDEARSTKARRDAAEDIEFWSNKAAFLGAVKLG